MVLRRRPHATQQIKQSIYRNFDGRLHAIWYSVGLLLSWGLRQVISNKPMAISRQRSEHLKINIYLYFAQSIDYFTKQPLIIYWPWDNAMENWYSHIHSTIKMLIRSMFRSIKCQPHTASGNKKPFPEYLTNSQPTCWREIFKSTLFPNTTHTHSDVLICWCIFAPRQHYSTHKVKTFRFYTHFWNIKTKNKKLSCETTRASISTKSKTLQYRTYI